MTESVDMKYWILSLLLLSSTVLAKPFDADLLVGKWQCFAKFNFASLDIKGTEHIFAEYKNDGTYETKTVSYMVMDNQKVLMKTQAIGKWEINQDIYSSNWEELLSYEANNPELEQRYEFEKSMREDKEFEHNQIVKLSKTQFHYMLKTEFDESTIYKCKRL